MINDAAIGYWKSTGYTDRDIARVCSEIDDRFLAARIEFNADGNLTVTVSSKVNKTRQGHVPACVRFLEAIQNLWDYPRHGSFILWLEDGMWEAESEYSRRAPIIAFGRRNTDYQTLLMPDPAFLFSNGFVLDRLEISETESHLTWHDKKPTLFWRGAASGAEEQGDNWLNAPRINISCISKNMGDPSKLDAAISYVDNLPAEHMKQRLRDCGIIAEYRQFKDFLSYRYLLDIDGFCCAWKSLFLKLSSGSLVVKTQSDFLQWYHERIIPWVHYIPVMKDYSDIMQILDWLAAHDNEARQISANARSLMDKIDYYDASKAFAELISCIIACQRR